jgi:hypothetical protein
MITLLTLPRELRDKILSLVISTPSEAPANHSTSSDLLDLTKNVTFANIRYIPHLNRAELMPTLLVSRQLHDETLAAIDILPSKHTYDLDILLVNGIMLYPTWLSIPTLTNVVDKIHTSIRIDLTAARQYHGFRLGCGGPPTLVWSFLAILNRFLSVGPVGHPENPDGFAIKVLEIDIVTPDVPESAFLSADRYQQIIRSRLGRRAKRGAPKEEETEEYPEYVVSPSILSGFLSYHMSYLLRQWDDRYYWDKCQLIFERVGFMRMTIDGEFHCEWDIAELLQNARLGPYSFRKAIVPAAAHKKWKMSTYDTRKGFGLPVLPDEYHEADELESGMKGVRL